MNVAGLIYRGAIRAVRSELLTRPYRRAVRRALRGRIERDHMAGRISTNEARRRLDPPDALTAADQLLSEIDELYGVGILEHPDADDPDDPRQPLAVAVTNYRTARSRYFDGKAQPPTA